MSQKADTPTNDNQLVSKTSEKPRGQVAVIQERCKGCAYCVEFCPLKVLVMSSRFNAKGYHYPEVADPAACSGCGLCGMYCPDFAITGARVRRE
ncbi:MAG: 4Fe-4S dicluster domain-containing protein [Planctomycetota bacterium]